jgi:flavin-binding protein dodecin
MTPEQYAESLIEVHDEEDFKKAIRHAISDVQHTIEALDWAIGDKITYYQQALTYLQNKLK